MHFFRLGSCLLRSSNQPDTIACSMHWTAEYSSNMKRHVMFLRSPVPSRVAQGAFECSSAMGMDQNSRQNTISLILNALTSEDLFRTVEADATPTDSQESERWKGVYITHLNWLQNMPGVKKLVRLIEQLLCVRIMKQNGSIVLNGDSVLCRIAASLLNVSTSYLHSGKTNEQHLRQTWISERFQRCLKRLE